jgi:hypothetical protein
MKRYSYPICQEQREQLIAIKRATGASVGWMVSCAISEWIAKHAVPGSVAGDAVGVTPSPDLKREDV